MLVLIAVGLLQAPAITLFDLFVPKRFTWGTLEFGRQWNLSVEPFYVFTDVRPSPQWGFRFGISLLLPE
jgi:hypothetical protein